MNVVAGEHASIVHVDCACVAVTHLVSFEPNLSLLSRISNFPLVEKRWIVIFPTHYNFQMSFS